LKKLKTTTYQKSYRHWQGRSRNKIQWSKIFSGAFLAKP